MVRLQWNKCRTAVSCSAATRFSRAAAGALLALALTFGSTACVPGVTVPKTAPDLRTDPFLDTLQLRTFRWFWDTTNPKNGLVPDRWPSKSFSSVAAVGFGLTAYPIGVERGFISRAEARTRVRTTLEFLWNAPQGPNATGVTGHQGFFYHFLDMETGLRFETVELSTIDTALLLAGALACREYFEQNVPDEIAIRDLADSLYLRVNWQWAVKNPPLVNMGWTPEQGFNTPWDWRGYDEAMIVYILALGSPTHPIGQEAWGAWTDTYVWRSFQGEEHVNFAPLFGHQYSHLWIDFRGIQDSYMRARGIDYFENSRRAALSQRAYAIANPNRWRDYGADIWGLTASDGPLDTTMVVDGQERRFYTYAARGAAATEIRDDGTIAPTAVGGSLPFAPEIALPALKAMRSRYGVQLFDRYGFLDAFNPTYRMAGVRAQHGRVVPGVGWFDTDYLGIDQGPILGMVENYRSDLIWGLMRRNPYVKRGLQRAGFRGGWLGQ